MVDLALFPEQLAGTDVRGRIIAISKPSRSELYSPSGEVLGEGGYRKYTNNLGLVNIPATVSVQYALVVSVVQTVGNVADNTYRFGPGNVLPA